MRFDWDPNFVRVKSHDIFVEDKYISHELYLVTDFSLLLTLKE